MESRESVKKRIAAAFSEFELEPTVVEDIAFHMTDWKENLEDIVRLYENGEQLTNDEIRRIVLVFLAHVPNHVAAAKKLAGLGPIEDVFEVGVLREDD
jgi:hypothetical protein